MEGPQSSFHIPEAPEKPLSLVFTRDPRVPLLVPPLPQLWVQSLVAR